MQIEAARRGFQATYNDRSVLSIAEKLLEISREGLIFLSSANCDFLGEEIFLTPLFKLVEKRETLAEKMLLLYQTKWQGDIQKIFSDL